MIRQEIEDLLRQHPFEPFVIRLSSGGRYEVVDSALAALLKSGIFIAQRNSDRRIIVPFLHIAAIETPNGRQKPSPRRRRA